MLENLINNYVSPLLKEHDFKKKKMTWNRSVGSVVQVIEFQLASYSKEGDEVFTINLGVFRPDVWRVCWQKPVPKFVTEAECFPRVRIGQLLSSSIASAHDVWWTCPADIDDNRFSEEITELLEYKCLPFLDSTMSVTQIDDYFQKSPATLQPVDKIYLAIIKASIGDQSRSKELLEAVCAISDPWRKRTELVQGQLGF